MKNKYIFSTLIIALTFTFSFGQNDGISRGVDKKYDKLSYVATTKELLKLVEKGNKTPEVYKKLANSYYFNSKMEDAAKWYGELLMLDAVVEYEYYYRYAMSLKAIGDYENANVNMKKFATYKPEDSRAILFSKSPNYLEAIEALSGDFELENLDLNSRFSDFGTSFYKDGIVFASSRGDGELYKWNEQPFLDLYFKSDDSVTVVPFSENLNTKFHESSTSFTQDGNTVYFTRNNYFKGKVRKSGEKVNGLKIFKAEFVNGAWKKMVSMPFNNDDYNVAHPALSLDETKLYFASDMPGTHGKSDIYYVDILEDGAYGEPVNLGDAINTEGRENFPYISNNGTLYFSSDGQQGLGGLDIFMTKLDDPNQEITNLGKPINSSRDDFEFIIDEFSNIGYLTSNRYNGKGDDDIYKFTRTFCTQLVSGTTLNKKTNAIIPYASVVVINQKGVEVQNLTSDQNGAFNYEGPCNKQKYSIIASKDGYIQADQTFLVNPKKKGDVVLTLKLTPETSQPAEVGMDLVEVLNLNPIYFDFDKSNIRPDAELELKKVIDYMIKYPSVRTDVQSHTDSRASDDYNWALSNRRNVSTKQYIIQKGNIAADRLEGKGYGETMLVNSCSNDVKCTEEEHDLNRRSNFIIISR
ncbi:OmpA family protein [Psychroserpens sp. NJDZ02]|uniref:OmpA family protein n=1 Tax=Psychroserpens sp. NJDZ02 TaxID=2570561 RepID=UPI0010A931FE|nr:OmpA family protein [Psychroserpens sp. NJDZ02]QCE40324.1 flagellar motor protein MotB [Psychroserpens sp. NJDZ02]